MWSRLPARPTEFSARQTKGRPRPEPPSKGTGDGELSKETPKEMPKETPRREEGKRWRCWGDSEEEAAEGGLQAGSAAGPWQEPRSVGRCSRAGGRGVGRAAQMHAPLPTCTLPLPPRKHAPLRSPEGPAPPATHLLAHQTRAVPPPPQRATLFRLSAGNPHPSSPCLFLDLWVTLPSPSPSPGAQEICLELICFFSLWRRTLSSNRRK